MLTKIIGACALLSTAGLIGTVHAGVWPERPVQLIVPFSPGGIADTIARSAAEHMSRSLGQPIIIDNRPGASSTIGTNAVSRAPADGYTLLFASDSSNVLSPLLYKNVTYTFDKNFDAIGEIGDTPFVLVVNADLPVQDVRSFVEYARQRQAELNYASTGVGGAYHLAAELFADQNDIKLTHIPYKGGGEFIVSLLAGETHAVFGALATFAPHIKAGKLRALAIASEQRLHAFPDLPTFREAGFPDYSASARFGLTAPKGVPQDARDKLTSALNETLQDPTFREQFESQGMHVLKRTSSAEYTQHTEADAAQWSGLINKLQISLD